MSDLNKKNINYGALNRFYQDLKSHDISTLNDKIDNIDIPEYIAGDNISIDPSTHAISATYRGSATIEIEDGYIYGTYYSGDNIEIDEGRISCTYELPTAAANTKGGVKVGDGLNISNEVLSTIVTPDKLFKLIANPDLIHPLTFEATEDNTEIIFKYNDNSTINIETSKDGENWTQYSSSKSGTTVGILNTSEQLFVRGANKRYYKYGQGCNFIFSKNTYVYGNIMSLIDKYNYPLLFELEETNDEIGNNFIGLFKNNTKLLLNQNKKLYLPATTLANGCYSEMFRGCTSLTSTPELPATTLANGCYDQMFRGCTGLTNNVPELPAKTTMYKCYSLMFEGCTNLTVAPELPAINAAESCYWEMFYNCSSLTTAPELPATTLARDCYSDMFLGCSSLVNAPTILPATTLAYNCYGDMFYNCSSLTTAPELPATTLASDCYFEMFAGCSSLNYIKCLATNVQGTYDWMRDVSPTGTFVTPQSTSWSTGNSGIPSGWTRVDSDAVSNA